MRKRYLLLKDTPEVKKGAILEEMCDDGTQDYKPIEGTLAVKGGGRTIQDLKYWKKFVENQPEWFQPIEAMYVSKDKVKGVKKFLGIK